METNISNLKTQFGEIADIQKQVKSYSEILQIRINKLKQFYKEFLTGNRTQLFIFGLDSLNFQSKLIDIEHEDMKRIYLVISNRMYCEYYKLYRIITAYITETGFDKKILDLIKGHKFPVYKDLEPYKEYDFSVVVDINDAILLLLNTILGYLEGKQHELHFHEMKKNIGLNIDNFISSFDFEITVIREKVNLFLTYLNFFHKLHLKQFQRFRNKLQLLYSHVNKDIKFDEALQMNDEKKNNSDANMFATDSNNPTISKFLIFIMII